ncbi:MAG TPA: choice-of-anchor tandem repeat GloVer-containing protein [Bryobacteraceae bacterium]|nr:choice-of-anchor tandem repeat GloVer-containing protein [Bryobacteraceae bacterium]
MKVFALRVSGCATILAALTLPAMPPAAAAATYSVIYSFKGGADGASPYGGLVQSSAGQLFGTTYTGGTGEYGTVFELGQGTSGWEKTVLHNFSGPDGEVPSDTLVFDSAGNLYGRTRWGGANNGGTVFDLIPPSAPGDPWTQNVLYSMPSGSCNNLPRGPLGSVLISPSGALITTASVNTCVPDGGTLFLLRPPAQAGGSWTESTLINFTQGSLGSTILAGVVGRGNSVYGTAWFNTAAGGCGDVYESTPTPSTGTWTGTLVHAFQGSDGCNSGATLTPGPNGVFYGTTYDGGILGPCIIPTNGGCGVVFELTPPAAQGGTWTESVLYYFTAANGDGAYPSANVVLGPNGVLYGTTQYGGSATTGSPCSSNGVSGCGTVFQLTPPTTPGGAWTETILHSFTGQNGDGSIPMAGLLAASDGTLYGTTSGGGASNKGTVFSIVP